MFYFMYFFLYNGNVKAYPSSLPISGSIIWYEKFNRFPIKFNNRISKPSQSIFVFPAISVDKDFNTNGGWEMAATTKRWVENPLINLRGNRLTFGLDNFPFIQDVRTMGVFEPNPSVYKRCVYKTYGFSWNIWVAKGQLQFDWNDFCVHVRNTNLCWIRRQWFTNHQ